MDTVQTVCSSSLFFFNHANETIELCPYCLVTELDPVQLKFYIHRLNQPVYTCVVVGGFLKLAPSSPTGLNSALDYILKLCLPEQYMRERESSDYDARLQNAI